MCPPVNEKAKQSATAAANESEMFEQFEIVFDPIAEPILHCDGTPIRGQLKIKLKKETILNAIHLQFKGKAAWIGSGKKDDKEGQTEKVYFDKNFVLLERPPGHPEPGHFKWAAHFAYSLPFECPLPTGCETSYESPEAHIRYFARAILETEQREKFIVKRAFTILRPPDLYYLVPPHSEPISRKETVRFGGCCCRNKIDAEIRLPKREFAPGEDIVGSFFIDSKTARYAVDHIEIRLLDGAERILPEPEQSEQTKHALHADGPAPETSDQNEEKPEAGRKKKQSAKNGKASTTTTPRSKAKMPDKATTICHRVVAGSKLDAKALLGGDNQQQQQEKHGRRRRSARIVGIENVTLIKVPPVIPTIERDYDDDQHLLHASNKLRQQPQEVEEGDQQRVMIGSQSTVTIRARKEPFIGVQYALQVALGTHILLEVPIKVHPIPIVNKEIDRLPFAGGPQPITEPDEADMRGGPFTFTPYYPIYLQSPTQLQSSPTPIEATNETQVDGLLPAAQLSPNGTANAGGEGIAPSVSETVTRTVTTTTVHKPTPAEEDLMPNGAKPYLHVQQQLDNEEQTPRPHTVVMNNGAQNDQQQSQQAPVAQQPEPVMAPENHQHIIDMMVSVSGEHKLNGQQHNGEVRNANDDQSDQYIVEESYEMENEDGTKTTIFKRTEQNHHFDSANADNDGTGRKNDEADDGTMVDQQQKQQNMHNQQMDVSMSG